MLRSLVVLCLVSVSAAASDPRLGGPRTYATPSPNKKYLFVMIAPRPTDPHPALVPEQTQHEKDIYARYADSGSGLYLNDGSTTPLWRLNLYSYRVWPADDGIHLVRIMGDFPLSEKFPAAKRLPDEVVATQILAPALSFHENGNLLKVYVVRELVADVDKLPHSLQHVLWSADGVLTADGKQFGLMTQEPRQIYFDLETGNIAINRPAGLGNAQVWVVRISIGITAFVGLILLAAYIYREWGAKKKSVAADDGDAP